MILIKRAKASLLFWLFFYAFSLQGAQPYFSFTPALIEAQKHIVNLKIEQARQLLAAEKKSHPDNIAPVYLEAYIDYYLMLINQDDVEVARLEKQKNTRLLQYEKIPVSSPYHLYAQALTYLQWATIHIQHEKYVSAAIEFRSAYNLLHLNQQKFPQFLPTLKEMGMLKTVLGAVPDNYQWILSITGFKGNIREGIAMVKTYLNSNIPDEQFIEKNSARQYLILLELNYNSKEEAWKYCEEFTKDVSTNLSACYIRSFVAIKTGNNDDAINTLLNKPTGTEYVPFLLLDYELGIAKLNRLDSDADMYLKRFVSFYKGRETIKDAYKRLSWFYLIHDNKEKYEIYKGLSQKYGASLSAEEKMAEKESQFLYTPHVQILKGRLLFDGGYLQKAEQVFNGINEKTLINQYQKIEFQYRLARVMHEQKKLSKAIELYIRVIELSDGTKFYFAPNSCLQLGYINEKLGMIKTATYYYEKVLTYKNYEYKTSISQKAKAALNKLQK